MNKSDALIIVVEDDTAARKGLVEAIKRHGYRVLETKTGDDAINAVRLKPPHAFVIDCMLPKMGGVQLAERIRELGFTETPIVFVTGIFKDKGFAAEALARTKALDVLYKPVLNEELLSLLDNALARVLSSSKLPLFQLLAKPFASHRERRKALELVEDMTGFDIPFVLCILMDAEASGHLNLIGDDGKIFGVTFSNGHIIEVDVENAREILARVVVEQGFCDDADVRSVLSNTKGDVLQHLIGNNLMSPHAAPIARNIQMLECLRLMVSPFGMQINFSPANPREVDAKIDMTMLTPLLHEVIERQTDDTWLNSFYQAWMDHPIRLGPNYTDSHQLMTMDLVSRLPGILDEIRGDRTIEEIAFAKNYSMPHLLKALHLLAIRRIIVFDENRKSKVSGQDVERLRQALKELSDRNYYDIFRYFGASQSVPVPEVERIFKDFERANHPDKLPKDVSDEVKNLNGELFNLVKQAHDTLKDTLKRERYDDQVQKEKSQRQTRAKDCLDVALRALHKGQYQEALQAALESQSAYPSHEGALYETWARIKISTGSKWTRDVQAQVKNFLESYPPEKRRNSVYQTVLGLFYLGMKDRKSAAICLDRALKFDPDFLPARREVSALDGKVHPKEDVSWADELGTAIRSIFKRG